MNKVVSFLLIALFLISCSEYQIRRHNEYIEIMKPLKKHDSSKIYNWKFGENLVIPNLSVNLSWKNLEERLGYNLNKDVTFQKQSPHG